MNKQDMDIMNILYSERYINQRKLAEKCGHSLGIVNRSLKQLINQGYIDEKFKLTDKAKKRFKILNLKMLLFWLPVLECVWFQ